MGPALAYRGASHSTGCFFVIQNDTDSGVFGAQIFDVARLRWEAWPSFGDLVPAISDPFSVDVGGQVVIIDEANMNAVAFIDASAARSTGAFAHPARWCSFAPRAAARPAYLPP